MEEDWTRNFLNQILQKLKDQITARFNIDIILWNFLVEKKEKKIQTGFWIDKGVWSCNQNFEKKISVKLQFLDTEINFRLMTYDSK